MHIIKDSGTINEAKKRHLEAVYLTALYFNVLRFPEEHRQAFAIGLEFKKLMEISGMDKTALSMRSGLSIKTVSQLLNGMFEMGGSLHKALNALAIALDATNQEIRRAASRAAPNIDIDKAVGRFNYFLLKHYIIPDKRKNPDFYTESRKIGAGTRSLRKTVSRVELASRNNADLQYLILLEHGNVPKELINIDIVKRLVVQLGSIEQIFVEGEKILARAALVKIRRRVDPVKAAIIRKNANADSVAIDISVPIPL